MNMRIDQPWRDIGALQVHRFCCLIAGTDADNAAISNRQVGRFDCAGKEIHQAPIAQEQIGRLFATRYA